MLEVAASIYVIEKIITTLFVGAFIAFVVGVNLIGRQGR